MINTDKIIACAQTNMEGSDLFIVECKCSPSNEVELIIDSDTKVTIEKCIELSRLIEAEFDREVEDFSLTVASAGIGEDLKHLRQYQKIVGRPVEVLQSDGIKLLGKLDEVSESAMKISYEEKITVENSSGKKKKVLQEVTKEIPFNEIKYTKESLDFK